LKAINLYTGEIEEIRLNPVQRLILSLTGKLKIGMRKYPGWRGSLPFYLYKCPICGEHHIDYPHGYTGYLRCSKTGLSKEPQAINQEFPRQQPDEENSARPPNTTKTTRS